jgi:hypothetical protein
MQYDVNQVKAGAGQVCAWCGTALEQGKEARHLTGSYEGANGSTPLNMLMEERCFLGGFYPIVIQKYDSKWYSSLGRYLPGTPNTPDTKTTDEVSVAAPLKEVTVGTVPQQEDLSKLATELAAKTPSQPMPTIETSRELDQAMEVMAQIKAEIEGMPSKNMKQADAIVYLAAQNAKMATCLMDILETLNPKR